MKIMASSPIISWQIDGETVIDFIFLGSKMTADGDWNEKTLWWLKDDLMMKLKDACSLEENLWQT